MKPAHAPAFSLAAALFGAFAPNAAAIADFQARTWKISNSKSIPYRLYVPQYYDKSKSYPIVVAMHGAGERGNNNVSQLNHAFTHMWADDSIQNAHPAFVIAPQCPANEWWVVSKTFGDYKFEETPITDNLKAMFNILDSLEREFNIDHAREYITGMSMGGAATWYALAYQPDRFAAAVPVCGGGDTAKARVFDRIPIWTFHEVDDPTVPVAFTRHLATAIRAVGGSRFKYTEYPASMGYGHESWKPAGKDPALHRWLFQQAKAATAIRGDQAGARAPIYKPAAGSEVLFRNGLDGLGRLRLRAPAAGPILSPLKP